MIKCMDGSFCLFRVNGMYDGHVVVANTQICIFGIFDLGKHRAEIGGIELHMYIFDFAHFTPACARDNIQIMHPRGMLKPNGICFLRWQSNTLFGIHICKYGLYTVEGDGQNCIKGDKIGVKGIYAVFQKKFPSYTAVG